MSVVLSLFGLCCLCCVFCLCVFVSRVLIALFDVLALLMCSRFVAYVTCFDSGVCVVCLYCS